MNRNCYRIIFNALRGQLMAVCESATGCGKAANAGDSPATDEEAGSKFHALRLSAVLPIALAVAQLGLFSGDVSAQVVAYRNAPGNQQPTVLGSNGVPVVNVQSPSAAGVSRNTYSQFDVDEKGVVLNNSRKGANTHLAGPVSGNPWMAKGTARVIVNEVISSNPSKLSGTVEVAGSRAEVVIANPSGVEVNGGRFINASKATITTGKPNFKNGAVDNYEVRQGTVNVGSKGLDASQTDYTAILARAVTINGAVQAKELKIIAGANQVSGDLKDVKPIAGKGAAPEYALDVSELGGMYAGKISMVGTEAGVGVRNAGKIVAGTGEISISADGKVLNPGQIIAGGDIQITAIKGVTNKGRTYAQGALKINTQGSVTNTGLIASQGDLSIEATGDAGIIFSDKNAYLIAGLAPDGQLNAIANLTLNAGKSIQANGQSRATAEMTISAPSIDLSGGDLLAYNVRIEAILNQRRSRSRRQSEDGGEAQETLLDGEINIDKAKLRAANLLQIEADGTLRTSDANVQAEQLAILVDTLDNKHGNIQGGSTALIVAGSKVDNTDGKIDAQGTLAIVDPKMTDKAESETLAIVNTGGNLTAGQLLQLEAASLSRDGHITSQGDLSLALHGDYAHGVDPAFYEAAGNISLSFTGTVSNQGVWHTDKNLGISASKIANAAAGEIVADGTLTLTSNSEALNNRGLISGNQVNLGGFGLDNAGGRIQGGALIINVAQGIDNERGTIDITGAGQILAGGDLNNDGGRLDTGSLQLEIGGSVYNRTLLQTHTLVQAESSNAAHFLQGGTAPNTTTTRSTTAGELAGITARNGDISLDIGHDLILQGSELRASGQINGIVYGDVRAEGLSGTTSVATQRGSGQAWGSMVSEELTLVTLHAGQTISLTAGGSADYRSANIKTGGDLSLAAVTGDLRIATQGLRNTQTKVSESSVFSGYGADGETTTNTVTSTSVSTEISQQGGSLESGGKITLAAGRDLRLEGADAKAAGEIQGWAGHNIQVGTQGTISTTKDEQSSRQQTTQLGANFKGSGMTLSAGRTDIFAPDLVDKIAQTRDANGMSSPVFASNTAPGSLTLRGASIDVGQGEINLTATGDVTLQATWDRQQSTQQNRSALSGLFGRLFTAQPTTINTDTSSTIHGQLAASNIAIVSSKGAVNLVGIDADAGQSLWIESDGATRITSSRLTAYDTLGIHARGELDIQGLILNPTDVSTLPLSGADAVPVSRQSILSGGQALLLEGGTGLKAGGVALQGKDIQIGSQGDIVIAGGIKQRRNGDNLIVDEAVASTLNGDTVTIRGIGESSNLALDHVVIASTGKARISSTGDISIDPGINYSYQHWTTKHSSGGWFSKKTTVTEHVRESTVVAPSKISANEIEVLAGGDITLTATRLDSAGKTTVQAGGDIAYYAAKNESYNRDDSQTKRSLFGFTYSKKSSSVIASQQKALVTELQSESDVLSTSAGRTTLEGTHIASKNGNVIISGKTGIDLRAATDSSHNEEHHSSTSFGGFSFDPIPSLQKKRLHDNTQDTVTPVSAEISGGRVLLVSEQGAITLKAGKLSARNALSLAAAGDITLGIAEAWQAQSNQDERISATWPGKKSQLNQTDTQTTTPVVSQLSGNSIAILAGGDLTLVASRLTADTGMKLQAGGNLSLLTATQVTESHELRRQDNNLLNPENVQNLVDNGWQKSKVKDENTSSVRQALVTELITPGTIDLQSVGDTTLVAPILRASQLNIEVGGLNGVTVNPQAQLHLLGVTQSDSQSYSHSGKSLMWQSMAENGHLTETVRLPDLQTYGATKKAPVLDANGAITGSAPGHAETLSNLIPSLNVPGGIVLGSTPLGQTVREQQSAMGQSYTGGAGEALQNTTILDLRAQTAILAQQPGLAWLQPLTERQDVDWKKVQLAHEQWDFKHSGLTQEGGIIITAIVTYLTWGWGSGIASYATGTATSATTSAALNAGFSALMSQATVSLINNKGDIGKTLEELGKEESVKQIVTSMLTAWLTTGITNYLQSEGVLTSDLSKASTFDRFASYSTKAVIGASVQSAIQGRPLEETLKTAVIDATAQTLTSGIGDWGKDALLEKTLAHAAVQCLTAEARGKDCGSGALGGATAELLSSTLGKLDERTREAGYQQSAGSSIAGITGMLVTKAAGGDSMTGLNAAQMVDYYNRQLHLTEKQKAKELFFIAQKHGLPYTLADIEDAMRWANYGGETAGSNIRVNSVLDALLKGPAANVYAGAAFDSMIPGIETNSRTGYLPIGMQNGQLTLQQDMNGVAKPNADLIEFIQTNTTGYTWNPGNTAVKADPYAGMAWTSNGNVPTTDGSNVAQRYGNESANGKYFSLPTTYCPAASCTNFDSIAWGTTNSEDQHKLGDYQTALGEQNTKALVKTGILGLTLVMAPPTLGGSIAGGAILGGGNSLTDQLVDTGKVDAVKTVVSTGGGAAFGALGYGGFWLLGKVWLAPLSSSASNGSAAVDAVGIGAKGGAAVADTGGLTNTASLSLEQQAALKGLTQNEFDRLVATGANPKSKTFTPALSVAQDLQTGQISQVYGNSLIGAQPAWSTTLGTRAAEVPADVLASYIKTHGFGSHAEVYAVNELLLARPTANLGDIAVFTMETKIPQYMGQVKPPCPHCDYLLEDVVYVK